MLHGVFGREACAACAWAADALNLLILPHVDQCSKAIMTQRAFLAFCQQAAPATRIALSAFAGKMKISKVATG
jgi:hypothetical protein